MKSAGWINPILVAFAMMMFPPTAHAQVDNICAQAGGDASLTRAATLNALSLKQSTWTFFQNVLSKPEGPGWEIYVPLIKRSIGSACDPETPGFALALATWQSKHDLKSGQGVLDSRTAVALKKTWQERRAHLKRVEQGNCIAIAKAEAVRVPQNLTYANDRRWLDKQTFEAYSRMREAFKEAFASSGEETTELKVVSALRAHEDDVASCTSQQCNTVNKAQSCSAHWSGRAIDLDVGGLAVDSTYLNRVQQSRRAAYNWLLDNAAKFGFVNYAFEPWHWEWQDSVKPY